MAARLCLVCQNQAELLCLRCQEPYCSYECQSFDWSNHKDVCIAMPSLVTAANFETARQSNPILMDILKANDLNRIAARLQKKTCVALNVNTDGVLPAKPFKQNNINPNHILKMEVKAKPSYSIKVEVNNSANVSKLRDFTTNSREIRKVTIQKLVEVKPQELNAPNSSPIPTEIEGQQKPLEMNAALEQSISSPSSTLAEAWTKSFPIEETGFVKVYVQFTPMKCSQTAWVMLEKNLIESINLLREINKNVSAAPNVKREEIKVNQLYRVLFEDIYYRGITLEPVTDGLVLVRLIDYGKELKVPIDSLKSAIPRMNSNALAFQIKFQTPREVAINDVLNVQIKSMADGDIMNVLVEGEELQ